MQFIRKNIKPILIIIVVAFIVSIFYGLGQYRSSGNRPQTSGGLVAEVNNTGISYQQWQNAFYNFISRYDNQTLSNMTDETLAFIKNSVTDQLINSTLLLQHAQNTNITIPESDINEEIEKIKSSFESETDFNDALKRSNITLRQLKDDINRQLMIGEVIEREYDSIEISEEELSQYYEENKEYFFEPEKRKTSHILVEDKEEAQKILNQLNDRMVDFEQLAREKSICPSSEQGGDLGYITRGQMVEEFETAAFSLEAGQISEIVKTEYGYHIIKCEDIQEEYQPTFEEAKDDIEAILKNQKQNSAIDALLTQLREDSEVIIHYDFTSELETSIQPEIEEPEETSEVSELTENDSQHEEEIVEEELIIDN
jgi:parvulin-like peptidyl-prolyl isomerase